MIFLLEKKHYAFGSSTNYDRGSIGLPLFVLQRECAVYIELRGGKAVIRAISAYRKFVIKDKDNKMCKK